MNIYKTPESELDEKKEDSKPSNIKSIVLVLVGFIGFYLLNYHIIHIFIKPIVLSLGPTKENYRHTYLVVDAVVSSIAILFYYYTFLYISRIRKYLVVLALGVLGTLFWAIESNFLINGLNDQYPAWYEINMAINTLIVSLIVIFIHKRMTKR